MYTAILTIQVEWCVVQNYFEEVVNLRYCAELF